MRTVLLGFRKKKQQDKRQILTSFLEERDGGGREKTDSHRRGESPEKEREKPECREKHA